MPKRFTTLLDPDGVRDPYPILAELRKTSPAVWDSAIETWLVTRHEDVKAVLADPRFSRDRRLTKFYTPPEPGEEDRFRQLGQDVIRQFFPMADAENKRRGEQAMTELAEWISKLADERRQEPRDDLLSDLIVGNQGEQVMSNVEIIMQIVVLVAAGSETTTLGGTHTIRLLLEHPDQLALLRADPSLKRNAVREVLRFDFGGAGSMPLIATEDLEIGGVAIRRGDMVMSSVGSANRDETVFDAPDRFDITRDTRESLAFGSGPHYCLGANLALQELDCMLEGALEFLPEGARLVDDELEWESIGLMRRPANLPVDFG